MGKILMTFFTGMVFLLPDTGFGAEMDFTEYIDKSSSYTEYVLFLFYSQPLFYKIAYTILLGTTTVLIWMPKYHHAAKLLINKIADIGFPVSILNVAVAMCVYAVTNKISNGLAAIAAGLMSSFVGYSVMDLLDDLMEVNNEPDNTDN